VRNNPDALGLPRREGVTTSRDSQLCLDFRMRKGVSTICYATSCVPCLCSLISSKIELPFSFAGLLHVSDPCQLLEEPSQSGSGQ